LADEASNKVPALLALEDGSVFRGVGFGAAAEQAGELVFNTAITGYQEILTDPSYRGQIVLMTAPEIGNVGVNAEDFESERPFCAGFVVRNLSPRVSNWRAESDLAACASVARSGRWSRVWWTIPPPRSRARASIPRWRAAIWSRR
jgi:carbamoyl-phosphate synthase small subunit